MRLAVFSLPLLISANIEPFVMRKGSNGMFGFTIQTKAKRRHFTTEILPQSQAEKVGLHDGWEIVEVNGYANFYLKFIISFSKSILLIDK